MKSARKLTRFMLCLSVAIAPIATAGAYDPPQVPRFDGAPDDSYSVFSATSTVRAYSSVELTSERYSDSVCVVFTELSMSPAPGSELTRIAYGLYSSSGSSRLSTSGSPASAQETLGGSFPPHANKNDRLSLGFRVEISPTSLPPPGFHTITLRSDLYASAYPPSGAVVDSEVFTIRVRVGDHYDVSVVPTGAAFSLSATSTTIAFGALESSDDRGADILVKSNVSFVLSLGSANGGAFVNASDGFRIPYSLSANGVAVHLASGGNAIVGSNSHATYGNPARFALVVTVIPFTDLPTEGAYSDLITVTLSAR